MQTGSNLKEKTTLAPGQGQSSQQEGKATAPNRRDRAQLPTDSIAVEARKRAFPKLMAYNRASLRRKTVVAGLLLIAIALLSACIDLYQGRIASPFEVFWCYGTWITQTIAGLTGQQTMSAAELMEIQPSYYSLLGRAGTTIITALAGALLAISGSLYQSVFKNPIASPSILGVSSGIQMGYVILVLVFGTAAIEMTAWRYGLAYGLALMMLVLMSALSKLISGKGKPLNIINMLVIGMILSQLSGVIVTYCSWYLFEDEAWTVYNNLSEVLSVDTSGTAVTILFVMTLASVTPIVLLRFRLNILSFSESDMRMLGVNSHRIQLVALASGTLMMIAAQVAVGTVAMISLVVPHVSRALFGAEFRKQFIGNMLLGALILVLCRTVLSFIPSVGMWLPIGTVVSIVVLPAFVWIIATQQRSWE